MYIIVWLSEFLRKRFTQEYIPPHICSSVSCACSRASLWIESACITTACTAKIHNFSSAYRPPWLFPSHNAVRYCLRSRLQKSLQQKFALRGHIERLNKYLCMFIAFINNIDKHNKAVKFNHNHNNKYYTRHCSLVCLCR